MHHSPSTNLCRFLPILINNNFLILSVRQHYHKAFPLVDNKCIWKTKVSVFLLLVVLIKVAFIEHFDRWQTRWSWSNALCYFMFLIYALLLLLFSFLLKLQTLSIDVCVLLWRHVRVSWVAECVCQCNWLLLQVKNVLYTVETITDHQKSMY